MVFSTLPFLVFFAVYFPLHLLIPSRYRIHLILAGSAFFYAYYRWTYLWIPILLTAVAYWGVLLLEREKNPAHRKRCLIATLVLLLIPLFFYKYTNFFCTSVFGPFFGWKDKIVNLPLPLGISFFTFTLIAYVVDVYNGRFPVEHQYRMLLAYVLYFPHQIAGPILKPAKLIPQLEQPKLATHARFTFGAMLIAVGLVKKLIFADTISPYVDAVYRPSGKPLYGADYLLAFYGFPMQIYCDFSGYTDMALGLAFLLGVRLPANFARPYCSTSLVDFWRRWHITFSFWLRDYLYIPLGGNRHGFIKQIRNVFITMILGGLWHGANWTFVIWGAIHACGISLYHIARHFGWNRWFRRVPKWMAVLFTFHVIGLTWIFFRAPDFSTAWRVLQGPFVTAYESSASFLSHASFYLVLMAIFYVTHRWDDFRRFFVFTRRVPRPMVWATITALIVLTVGLSGGSSAAFIYFDF